MEVVHTDDLWEWIAEMAKTSTERVRRWIEKHPDRKKEQDARANKKYMEKKKNDPEFMERRRAMVNESMRRSYHKRRAAMTPEELEEERARLREKMRKYREKKKAEKAAMEGKTNEKDNA